MTAQAMRCIKAENHPNADALRVYQFNYGEETLQIVANLQNTYEVGDIVAIIKVGSKLKNGTVIKSAALRGVKSFGMALGKTDAALGDDLTNKYCNPEPKGIVHLPWPNIESLYNIRKHLKNYDGEKEYEYRAKVKIHGSNGGVQLSPTGSNEKTIIAQSRSKIVTVDDDNMGFAKWVLERGDIFLQIRKNADELGITERITIFGEFCGKNIQKDTSISSIEKNIFAIFAIQIGGREFAKLETDPEKIKHIILGQESSFTLRQIQESGVFILPWLGESYKLNFNDSTALSKQADVINQTVDAVEENDPWVSETFGINGVGEGIVMYPIINGQTLIDRYDYSNLVFKAKGEKHKVVKTKKAVQLDPEVVNNVNEFCDLMVTENRLEQIAQRVGEFDKKLIGQFIKELSIDVKKESNAELEESNLEWKQVTKEVSNRAKKWWLENCEKI